MRINVLFLGLSFKVIWLALTPSIQGFPSWFYTKKYEKDDYVEVNSQTTSESSENYVYFKPRHAKNKDKIISDEIPMNYGLPQLSISEASICKLIFC